MWRTAGVPTGAGAGACGGAANHSPAARSKHAAALLGRHVYVMGGRADRVPLRDLWRYSLVTGEWEQIVAQGERPPALQDHSCVARASRLYVFGGELAHCADETPLWIYDVETNNWRKLSGGRPSGSSGGGRGAAGARANPRGLRGHSALVAGHDAGDCMLLYGGYKDLRGSTNQMWAFHFESESWRLVTSRSPGPPRHRHSAVLYAGSVWLYGGMHDLHERGDLWRFDIARSTWTACRAKPGPGARHGHSACRVHGAMLMHGGEAAGELCDDLWRFTFDYEVWEKIYVGGVRPTPRTEGVIIAVSELLLEDVPTSSPAATRPTLQRAATGAQDSRAHDSRAHVTHEHDSRPHDVRTQDRHAHIAHTRHSVHIPPNNKISPYDKTYIFKASNTNYMDGSANPVAASGQTTVGFLKEITKLSQINISRLGHNKCSYTVLTSNNDSQESLLRDALARKDDDNWTLPPSISASIVKSQSAHVINRKRQTKSAVTSPSDESNKTNTTIFQNKTSEMKREPISVPNFSDLTLPTPVLSPVEASKLVYLDSEEEEMYKSEIFDTTVDIEFCRAGQSTTVEYATVDKSRQLTDDDKASLPSSIERHTYENVPKATILPKSSSVRFQNYPDLEEASDENISTSDYASIEGVNKLSSTSTYSTSTGPSESLLMSRKTEICPTSRNTFGFCNPNYMGSDVGGMTSQNRRSSDSIYADKINIGKLLNTPDSGILDGVSKQTFLCNEMVELKDMEPEIGSAKVSTRSPPKSLSIRSPCSPSQGRAEFAAKGRAKSASRAERPTRSESTARAAEVEALPTPGAAVPVYIYTFGGRENGQAAIFKRPLSVWRFQFY